MRVAVPRLSCLSRSANRRATSLAGGGVGIVNAHTSSSQVDSCVGALRAHRRTSVADVYHEHTGSLCLTRNAPALAHTRVIIHEPSLLVRNGCTIVATIWCRATMHYDALELVVLACQPEFQRQSDSSLHSLVLKDTCFRNGIPEAFDFYAQKPACCGKLKFSKPRHCCSTC